jgi:hypothetical protein
LPLISLPGEPPTTLQNIYSLHLVFASKLLHYSFIKVTDNVLRIRCPFVSWRSWIRASWYNYESNQQDATRYVNLLFLVSSTCFGRCFRPLSGAIYCIYSVW